MPSLFKFLFLAILILLSSLSYSFADNTDNKELIENLLSNDKIKVNDALAFISANKPSGILNEVSSVVLTAKDSNKKITALSILKYYNYEETMPLCAKI